MNVNRALFELNGKFGYVPKPQCLFQDDDIMPLTTNNSRNKDMLELNIEIISGQQLPKPAKSVMGDKGEIIDPFVEVEIIGVASDCKRYITSVVNDNGFNPIWNKPMRFSVSFPELAFVRFAVWDSDPIGRDFIGQRTISLNAMATGYRHVHLTGHDHASLFVKIRKTYCKPSMIFGLNRGDSPGYCVSVKCLQAPSTGSVLVKKDSLKAAGIRQKITCKSSSSGRSSFQKDDTNGAISSFANSDSTQAPIVRSQNNHDINLKQSASKP